MGKPKNIKLKCKKCGKSPILDKTKSNENWQVFNAKCECGGKYELTLKDTLGNK